MGYHTHTLLILPLIYPVHLSAQIQRQPRELENKFVKPLSIPFLDLTEL